MASLLSNSFVTFQRSFFLRILEVFWNSGFQEIVSNPWLNSWSLGPSLPFFCGMKRYPLPELLPLARVEQHVSPKLRTFQNWHPFCNWIPLQKKEPNEYNEIDGPHKLTVLGIIVATDKHSSCTFQEAIDAAYIENNDSGSMLWGRNLYTSWEFLIFSILPGFDAGVPPNLILRVVLVYIGLISKKRRSGSTSTSSNVFANFLLQVAILSSFIMRVRSGRERFWHLKPSLYITLRKELLLISGRSGTAALTLSSKESIVGYSKPGVKLLLTS